MSIARINLLCRILFITSITVVNVGCIWLERPSPPELAGIPFINNDYATTTVVRKKEYSASGTIFTLALDGRPFAHIGHAEYTTFRVSQGKHVLKVIWDIAGFAMIAPGGGAVGDSPHRYEKEFAIQCDAGENYFYTMEGVVFVQWPEEGLVFHKVEQLEGEYSIENKKFIAPKILDAEHMGIE